MTIELILSEVVPSGETIIEEYTPAANIPISVIEFIADGAFINLANISVIWKYGTQNEELIWAITGSSKMPFRKFIPIEEIDGINKLVLVLNNETGGPVSLSGKCILETN
jgi:hypothetical protein